MVYSLSNLYGIFLDFDHSKQGIIHLNSEKLNTLMESEAICNYGFIKFFYYGFSACFDEHSHIEINIELN